jgi:hypothetical protein
MVAQLLSRNRRISINRNINTNNRYDGMLSADELAKGVPLKMFPAARLIVRIGCFA